MARSPLVKRLSVFLRSVIPADPAQLYFLCGIVCLIVAPHLRWSPEQLATSGHYRFLSREAFEKVRMEWFLLLSVAVYPLIFSAMAGYFICFWPGSRPARRILYAVLLPAIFGLSLICGRLLYIDRQQGSLFESSASIFLRTAASFASISWSLGSGLHFCLLGITLVVIFTWRLAFGRSSLPLTLAEINCATPEEANPWPRMNFLIWVLMGPLWVLRGAVVLVFMIPYIVSPHLPANGQSSWFVRASYILEAAILLGFTLCTVGREGRRKAWNSMQIPGTRIFFMALAVPFGIAASVSIGHFGFDRIQWVAHGFGNSSPPQIGSYFNLPDPWLLLLFFAALSEEVIFRGLLQPRFIKRYGLHRGIFLVGVVWAAFHFFLDPHSGESDFGVLLNIAFRMFNCLTLGYVLSWLTLRSGSVLPAALAHTFYNVMVISGLGPTFYGESTVRVGLWAVLAYVLFHHWPVQSTKEPQVIAAVPDPEIGL